ncbi:AAA family ATPase [Paenibacillus aestuarii]|uniref:AAA family ATPase n=1 Tax=Paenibacillus aestuarii TaxID=516965 RepID=A0ABW0K8G3_9BACL|nr:AAA family ATPase [Paenibacillus aestuarii]
MIIMLNGAFGAGKTTTAERLHRSLPDSMIFDPEEIGCMLRKLIPEEVRAVEERTDDFQDLALWRIVTVQIAAELKQHYNKHLIVPMTIYKQLNFDYICYGFKAIDPDCYHFCLTASAETLYKRLTQRGDAIGGWSFQRVETCVRAFESSRFEEKIVTDAMTTEEIIHHILAKTSLSI